MEEKANTIKQLIILFIACVWVLVILKEKQHQQEKALSREIVLGSLIDSLQTESATKDSLISRWEEHHVRIKEYAVEWDKGRTR